ncbi:hypothetical protein CHS0354_011807 [Potamilus streckersoni]|uniref:Uncharacterized protein n=1 Tax=Potamilus streckersoni TaxID=2493646 RepID=A0AAE0TGT2_9BIVA|nr:hypothetical protein CHS0354_011807 [Potamilus streckersoni]
MTISRHPYHSGPVIALSISLLILTIALSCITVHQYKWTQNILQKFEESEFLLVELESQCLMEVLTDAIEEPEETRRLKRDLSPALANLMSSLFTAQVSNFIIRAQFG